VIETVDNRVGAFGDQHFSLGKVGLFRREPQDLSTRGARTRHEVQVALGPERGLNNSVSKIGQPGPLAARSSQIVRKLPTVAVLYRRQQRPRLVVQFELNFGDAREIFADFVAVVCGGSPQLVKIDLLEKVEICGRAFAGARVPRVEKPAGVGQPGQVAPGRPRVDAGDHLVHLAASGRFEDMHVPRFGSGMRERHRHEATVARGDEPVDRRRPFGIDDVRIDQHPRAVECSD